MNLTVSELAKDPLFQLNTLLWLAQPLAKDGDITPLFYQKGFTVYAISPLLPIPPDLRLASQQSGITLREGVRPDVVLSQSEQHKHAVIECKAGSFGAQSSTAEQARSLLIAAGPRSAEIFGLSPAEISASILGYLIPNSDREMLSQTLSELRGELADNGLPGGVSCVLGLEITDSHLGIFVDADGGSFFSLPEGFNAFKVREPGTDPRPLYFIPYDPDIQQSEQERVLCKQILFERMQATIITAIGRAHPPSEIILESRSLLNDAMFGMFEHWENTESARHMRSLCTQFMRALMEATNSESTGSISFQPNRGWRIALNDDVEHAKVLDAVTRFSCVTLDLKTEPLPTLFDDTDDN